jgi:hypothetical protein
VPFQDFDLIGIFGTTEVEQFQNFDLIGDPYNGFNQSHPVQSQIQ